MAHRSGSHRVLLGQAMPTHWASAVHYGFVRSVVGELEVRAVASETRHAQNVPALWAAIGLSRIRVGCRAPAARAVRSASEWPPCHRLAVEAAAFIQPTLYIQIVSHRRRLAAGGELERGMSCARSSNGTEPAPHRTMPAARVASSQDATLADCTRRSRLAATIAQWKAPPFSSKARNFIDTGADTAPAPARCFVRAPAACVRCLERVMTGPHLGAAVRGYASGTLRWP